MSKGSRQTWRSTDCSTMTENKEKIPYELSDHVLEKYFRETGERQGWLPETEANAIVAVSGGGDSVALMWLFKKFYRGRFFVFHFNHCIRGEESDLDEIFVRDLANSWKLPVYTDKTSVRDNIAKGETLEEAARRLRREAILDMAQFISSWDAKVDRVFLGHNRDDLAETVLFNILRGSCVRGSVGITESTDYEGVKFYRPLLGLRRDFLRDVLRVRGITWRDDSTNKDTQYTRNFIRLKLLPTIRGKINRSAVEHLATFGEDMRKIRELEDERSRDLLKLCKAESFPNLALNRKIMRGFSNDERALVIREAGRALGLKTLSRDRCNELARLICKPSGFIFQWSGDMTVRGKTSQIIFERSIDNGD